MSVSEAALAVARQILEHGHVQRPWLGIAGYDVNRRLAGYYGFTSRSGVFVRMDPRSESTSS